MCTRRAHDLRVDVFPPFVAVRVRVRRCLLHKKRTTVGVDGFSVAPALPHFHVIKSHYFNTILQTLPFRAFFLCPLHRRWVRGLTRTN